MKRTKLYHYSNEDFEIVSPKFFGANQHTSTTRDSEVPRSYFYLNENDREKFFRGAKYRYTVGIDGTKIYDLTFDELGLTQRFGNYDELFRELKKRGYIGVRFLQIENREAVALFYPQKILSKEVL